MAVTIIVGLIGIVTLGFQLFAFVTYLGGGRIYYYEDNPLITWVEILVVIIGIVGLIHVVYQRSCDIFLEEDRQRG